MSSDVEKVRAAHAALEAALRACEAAGLVIECQELRRQRDDADAVAACVAIAKSRITSAERRAVPLALGGTVHVIEDHLRANSRVDIYVVTRVGRDYVYARHEHSQRERPFDLAHGCEKGVGASQIDPDDLYRVQRDLVKPPKGGAR